MMTFIDYQKREEAIDTAKALMDQGSFDDAYIILRELNADPILQRQAIGGMLRSDRFFLGEFDGRTIEWQTIRRDSGFFLLSVYALFDEKIDRSDDQTLRWKNSGLRERLNGSFFDECFNELEKSLILRERRVNEGNAFHGYPGTAPTEDSVVLLSEKEYQDLIPGKDVAKACYRNGQEAIWWLRTVGGYGYFTEVVETNGQINLMGNFNIVPSAVRPAIQIAANV